MADRNTDDRTLVTEAAAALDTAEIAVFRRAWLHWYGDWPDEDRIVASFIPYMFGGSAPVWVRDYARRVVSAQRHGHFVPHRWGFSSTYVRNPLLGYALAVVAAATLIILVVLASAAAEYITGLDGCITPPCY